MAAYRAPGLCVARPGAEDEEEEGDGRLGRYLFPELPDDRAEDGDDG